MGFETVNSSPADILVVDDEAYVREVMARYLKASGHTVRQADGVDSARREIERQAPALVYLDINMPGPSGLDLLKELGPRWPDVAVVMVTAIGDVATAVDALRAGAADFINKPATFENVKLVTARTLERRHLVLENQRYHLKLESLVVERTEELRARNRELLRTQDALVRGLCRLTESRDRDTGAHLDRMSRYAQILARRIAAEHPELPKDFDKLIHMAAPLHDIGKVGVPDSILSKPGPLTPEEFEIMKRHTIFGAETLAHIKKQLMGKYAQFLDFGEEICRSHHERWDGHGYPDGIAGDKIPLPARICMVADYLDACLSSRVYRKVSLHFDQVRSDIVGGAGTMFDPEVVAAFIAEESNLRSVVNADTTDSTIEETAGIR
ncbi:MAG: response regulator [Candidatus Sumerlaeaceae bacterium]|nr:response regulator [Candidatus Sumerlaeaceae bacterium]